MVASYLAIKHISAAHVVNMAKKKFTNSASFLSTTTSNFVYMN